MKKSRSRILVICGTVAIAGIYLAASSIRDSKPGLFTWEYRIKDDNDELIDYTLKQGDYEIASHHDRYRSEAGLRSTALGLNGRPDSLSVSWRNKATGKQFKNDISLLPILPKNGIDGGDLGFEIENDRLTLYVVTRTYTGGEMTGRPVEIHPSKKTIFSSN